MKRLATTGATMLMLNICIAQKQQTIYYDYQKTKIEEQYTVNASGEKNGPYKYYDRNSVLVEEATFLNGQLNGVYKKYTVACGKRELAELETYKNGELDGLLTHYRCGGMITKSGSYKAGKKVGKWTFIEPYSNYQLKDNEKQGCNFVKSEAVYNDDVPVMEGKYKLVFYPSGKVRSDQEYVNGLKKEQTWYFPNGKMEAYYKYDSTGNKYLEKRTYYTNGNIWENMYWENGQFITEGYYEDGRPDRETAPRYVNRCIEDGWKQLMGKDFVKALYTFEQGLKIDNSNLYLLGNYAHALLLNGRYDEALKIYKAYLDEKLAQDFSWRDMIKQDFSDFRKAEIESVYFDKILSDLNL